MKNMRRRLDVLERLAQFQPPKSPARQIHDRVLEQMSNEDLAALMVVTRARDAGLCRGLSEVESEVVAECEAAIETEARQMGFSSFADAQRIEIRLALAAETSEERHLMARLGTARRRSGLSPPSLERRAKLSA